MPRVRRYVTLYKQLSCGSTGYASVSISDIEVPGRTVEARGPRNSHGFTMITLGPAATASRLSSDHCTAAGYSGRPSVSITSLATAVMALTLCHCGVARSSTSWEWVVVQGCTAVASSGGPGCCPGCCRHSRLLLSRVHISAAMAQRQRKRSKGASPNPG